jgi:hypothetical protein
MSAILGHARSGQTTPPANPTVTPPSSASSTSPAPTSTPTASPLAQSAKAADVDVSVILDKLAHESSEKLDWRRSIVDLMKLLHLDSSLTARKQLAKELNYTGDTNDSAAMNIWLHKGVMTKLAENGGKVPDDLKH